VYEYEWFQGLPVSDVRMSKLTTNEAPGVFVSTGVKLSLPG